MTFLAQEPWCMTPEEIARLTDWQVEYLYHRPAAGAPPESDEFADTGEDYVPTADEVKAAAMKIFGGYRTG